MGVRARTSKEGRGVCHKRRALSASMSADDQIRASRPTCTMGRGPSGNCPPQTAQHLTSFSNCSSVPPIGRPTVSRRPPASPPHGMPRRIERVSSRPCPRRRNRRGLRRTSGRCDSRRPSPFLRRVARPARRAEARYGDKVFLVAIDERRRGDPVHNRDASAGEREALGGEIDDVGADRGAAGEPGLDRMPIRRGDVERLACDLRLGEVRDQVRRYALRGGRGPERHESRTDGEADCRHRRGERVCARRGPTGRRARKTGSEAGPDSASAAMRAARAGGAASSGAERRIARRKAPSRRYSAASGGSPAISRSNSSAPIASSSPSRAAFSREMRSSGSSVMARS